MEGRHVEQRPSVIAAIGSAVEVRRQHDVAEVGVGGVLADEAARLREVGVRTAVHVGHIQPGPASVEVSHDAVHQRVERPGIEGREVVLPPHLLADRGAVHAERVVHRPAGAGGIGVEDQRSVVAERSDMGLVLVVGAAGTHPAQIAGDRGRKQLVLGQTVVNVHGRQTQRREKLRGHIGSRERDRRRHGHSHSRTTPSSPRPTVPGLSRRDAHGCYGARRG